MKQLVRWLALVVLLVAPARATTLTGNLKGPDGSTPVKTLTFALSQQGAVSSAGSCGGPYVVVPTYAVQVALAGGGALPGGVVIVGNDCIAPTNTYYIVTALDAQGNRLFVQNWIVTGTSLDVGTILPVIVPQGTYSIGTAFVSNLIVNGTCTINSSPCSSNASGIVNSGLNGDLGSYAGTGTTIGDSGVPFVRLEQEKIPAGDAVVSGATCNGIADDTTVLTNLFNNTATGTGNTVKYDDNCNFVTPPTFSVPTYLMTLHLRGKLLTGGTFHAPNYTTLIGDGAVHSPNVFFGFKPAAWIAPASSATSPVMDISATAFTMRNISIGNSGFTGVGIQSLNGNAEIELDNVNAISSSNTAQPMVIRGGFGLKVYNSQFEPGPASTNPCILLEDNASNGDTIRNVVMKYPVCNYQGILWTSSGSAAFGDGSEGLALEDYLYENGNGTGNKDALNVDTTNNIRFNLMMVRTYVADSSGCTLNTGPATSGQNRLWTVEIIEPVGGGCIKGTENVGNMFAHVSQHISTLFPSGSPQWSGMAIADGFTWMSNPVYTMSYNGGASVTNNAALQLFPNDTSGTGTFALRLNKITATGQAKVLATGDTAVSPTLPSSTINPGTTGFDYIPIGGAFHCKGDNSGVTVGSLLTISSVAEGDGNGGDCHSLESTVWPSSDVSIIGILQNNSSGDYTVLPVLAQHGSLRTTGAVTGNALVKYSGGLATSSSVSDNGAEVSTTEMVATPNKVFVTGDFTDSTSTTLMAITGLQWTFPANQATNWSFHCALLFDQGSVAVSDSFGIGAVTVAPTQINASGTVYTAAGVETTGTLTGLNTTTSTAIVTFTPSAITTVWKAELDGTIEEPSNGSQPVVNIYVSTTTGTDNIIVKRGSYCATW